MCNQLNLSVRLLSFFCDKVTQVTFPLFFVSTLSLNQVAFLAPITTTSRYLRIRAPLRNSGYSILLCDRNNRCCVLEFASAKIRRVPRSRMTPQIYAFIEVIDVGFIFKNAMVKIYIKYIPLHIFTDSIQVFESIAKGTHRADSRLIIYISTALEAYNNHDISKFGLVIGIQNPSNALFKVTKDTLLMKIMHDYGDLTPVCSGPR